MAIHLSQTHQDTITEAAVAAYPKECCGLVLGQITPPGAGQNDDDQRHVSDVISLANAWIPAVTEYTDPDGSETRSLGQWDRYWIDPVAMLAVQRSARQRNLAIVGVYHSHPDYPAVPSECDRRLAWPVYSYLIVSVRAGVAVDVQSWRLDQGQQFQSEPIKILDTSVNKAPFLP
ncbi:MAG: Mov34/MPN/PAD-1 family protein [Nodosilinea sp.]